MCGLGREKGIGFTGDEFVIHLAGVAPNGFQSSACAILHSTLRLYFSDRQVRPQVVRNKPKAPRSLRQSCESLHRRCGPALTSRHSGLGDRQ